MHLIGNDVIEQALVVSNNQSAQAWPAHAVHAARHDFQRVYVQARIGLVHDDVSRVEHQHLQDLVALLLAARKARVQVALHDALVPFQSLQGGLELAVELGEAHFLALAFAGLHGEAQKVGDGHARDLDGILEGQKHAQAGALVGFHLQNILAVDQHLTLGHGVLGVAHDHLGECGFAVAVRPHDGVQFAPGNDQVDAAQDGQIAHAGVKITDLDLVLGDLVWLVGHAGSLIASDSYQEHSTCFPPLMSSDLV